VVSLPPVPKAFADDSRRQEVLAELEESKAELVILLGDEPVRRWLSKFDDRWKRLSDFGAEYGRRHRVVLGGKSYEVLPLAHSRQVAGLGSHSVKWRAAQEAWTASDAGRCPRRHVCAVAPR